MTLPASVQAASDRAAALIDQQAKGTPGDETQGAETPTGTPTGTPELVVDPEQQATGDVNPAPPTQQQPDDFETKYKTLQGKYNAEIPRLNQQVRTMQEQFNSLTAENTRLKEAGNQKQSDLNDSTRIDPDSLSEYGEEFATLAKQVNNLSDENERLRGQVGTVQETQGKTVYDGYINNVAAALKGKGRDFGQLNADPDFLTWLQDAHPFTGKPRHAALQEAEQAMDVERTMRIFEEYLGAPPPSNQDPKPKPLPNVQPNPASVSDINPPTPGTQGKIWTRGEISKLFKDKANGLYRGREADFQALQADVFAAQTQGRVR